MRRITIAILLTAALVAPTAPAAAATTSVRLQSVSFSPDVVSGRVGDVVRWQKGGGFHNVDSTQGMFRSGNATFNEFVFTRTFSAGTFPYVCEIHRENGMKGRIRIRPRLDSAPSGLPFTVRWATAASNTGSAFRVQYRIGNGDWKVWRSSTSANSATFGAKGSPVSVRDGRTYRFRARSIRNGNNSSYSPAVAFTP